MCFLTFGAFIDYEFVFHKFSENLVAATMFQASNGGEKTHWNNLVVLHPHLNLCKEKVTERNNTVTGVLKPGCSDNTEELKDDVMLLMNHSYYLLYALSHQ